MRVGVLTGGGDAPGLNAVIRGLVVRGVEEFGFDFLGYRDGWKGPLTGLTMPLDIATVADIVSVGGTILGSSRTNPLKVDAGVERIVENLRSDGVEALVAIGGEDTLGVATHLTAAGCQVIGVPKTIDNDLSGTDYTFGFDTAVAIATEAVDRLHTTARSHHRVLVVEVMGRHAGWIALHTGMAADAAVTLIPEVPYHPGEVADWVRSRAQRTGYAIVVAAEGATAATGELVTKDASRDAFGHVKLSGIGELLAADLEQQTGLESRAVVLGHLQRGGSPTAYDRVLASRLGLTAAAALRDEAWGMMMALRGTDVNYVPLSEATGTLKTVPASRYAEAAAFFG
ncbi:MAG: ATP-dependent 6-phosphofructokinase [Actinomycetales bacterium]|nr:ATP-dependent 6-phosphofructokinase [Actinomycetales bacterium]